MNTYYGDKHRKYFMEDNVVAVDGYLATVSWLSNWLDGHWQTDKMTVIAFAGDYHTIKNIVYEKDVYYLCGKHKIKKTCDRCAWRFKCWT
jgi:hypothetical protein